MRQLICVPNTSDCILAMLERMLRFTEAFKCFVLLPGKKIPAGTQEMIAFIFSSEETKNRPQWVCVILKRDLKWVTVLFFTQTQMNPVILDWTNPPLTGLCFWLSDRMMAALEILSNFFRSFSAKKRSYWFVMKTSAAKNHAEACYII